MNKHILILFLLLLLSANSHSELKKKEEIKIDWSQLEGVTPVKEKQIEEIKKINGKKLYCDNKFDNDYEKLIVFEFKSLNRVKVSGIDLENEKIIELYGRYKALSNQVVINYRYDKIDKEMIIFRKDLTIKQSISSYCKLLDDDESVSDKLNLMLKQKIIEKSQGNKF